jgi:hypothetical protein
VITLIGGNKIHKCHHLDSGFYKLAKMDGQKPEKSQQAICGGTRQKLTSHQASALQAKYRDIKPPNMLGLNSNY